MKTQKINILICFLIVTFIVACAQPHTVDIKPPQMSVEYQITPKRINLLQSSDIILDLPYLIKSFDTKTKQETLEIHGEIHNRSTKYAFNIPTVTAQLIDKNHKVIKTILIHNRKQSKIRAGEKIYFMHKIKDLPSDILFIKLNI